MGLELAELALEIEERYAIEIGEDDWDNVHTFGDLVDAVKRKIDQPLDPPIEESRNEIILQSLLAELRTRLPEDIPLDEETRLSTLSPYVKQYDIWSIVQRRFPELPTWNAIGFRRSYHVDLPSFLGFLGVLIIWIVVFGTAQKYFGESLWSFLGAAVPCLAVAFVWLTWICMRLPHRTVGNVATAIASKRQRLLKAREYSAEDIENDLRVYMSEAFAIKPEDIKRESGLVTDLALG